MSYCVDLVSEDSFYENLTLGITKLLEFNDRVCNVKVERKLPCDRVALSTWEQRHSVSLPEELRQFYASTDGFRLNWSYKYSENDILPVGCININCLSELCMTPSLKELLDLAQARQSTANANKGPDLESKSKVVELDDCKFIGKVVMVLTNGEASVWLLGRDGMWTWLADNFTTYFRMALVHQGLPGWQGLLSKTGILPWAELFLLIAPHLLEGQSNETHTNAITDVGLNHIDPSIFKPPSRHNARAANQSTRHAV